MDFHVPGSGSLLYTVLGDKNMAKMIFANSIINRKPLKIFNNGNMFRDFTYIDDVVKIMFQLINKKPEANDKLTQNYGDPSRSWAPFRIFNIGNGTSIPLIDF